MKVLRKFCVVSTPDAYLFLPDRTSDFTKSRSVVIRLAQRTLTEYMHFFLRKARRNSGNFAELSQDFETNFAISYYYWLPLFSNTVSLGDGGGG